MSPVNRAGSVSAIFVLRHSFLRVHMRSHAGPVTDISVFATEISFDRDEIFSI